MSARLLKQNPNARYHHLSAREAARIVAAARLCHRCGGRQSRLGIHHKDRNKKNQSQENLEVLCHRCHMREHRHEIGWAAYWKKKRSRHPRG